MRFFPVSRHLGILVALLLAVVGLWAATLHPAWFLLALLGAALLGLGLYDLLQPRRAVLRNYPVIGHFRYLLEGIRPEIRQYFIESDSDELPFSRRQRSIVYQRAKSELDKRPFGTLENVYRSDYEWINHSLQPVHISDHDFRVTVGEGLAQPYSASVFNISAMSFGAMSANAIRALNGGARQGRFYHDTGEGGISTYHREHGGDLVWEIGTGYFGCRDEQGRFSEERFSVNACEPQVKMIELKLSQGAKPGQGGLLPGAKVTREIASTRGIPEGEDCHSPAAHSAFSTPIELLHFVARLRELSGGKPVGFKLAIGHPWEWFAIARAMQETRILPDFIVVDGGEGGTGAAPLEFADHVGVPMREGLMLVHNTLVGLELRDCVRIAAAGKIVSAFDLAHTLAIGADWCNAARGFMFALGCIQSRNCHTGRCPTGVATQDQSRQRGLVPEDKAARVCNFQQNTLKALRDLLMAAGVEHPAQLGPEHVIRRVSQTQVRSLGQLYPSLQRGQLLQAAGGDGYGHMVFDLFWEQARAESFAAPAQVRR